MPEAHDVGGKLCFTMAVVEATIDKKTPPNIKPDSIIMGKADVIAGMTVATLSKALRNAKAWPPR